MVLEVGEVISLLSMLSAEEGMRVTVSESAKGGAIAGISALVGGIFAGPPGIAAGAALGGLMGYYATIGKFQSAAVVIRDMKPAQQQQIYNKVIIILRRMEYTDFVNLGALVAGDLLLRQNLTNLIKEHLQNQLGMTLLG